MILYLDTSALVKRYVEEPGSDQVDRAVAAATVVATSRVAYPEARAAFARRTREGGLTRPQLKRVVARLDAEVGAWVWVELDAALALEAGRLAEVHALRGFDAIPYPSRRDTLRACLVIVAADATSGAQRIARSRRPR